MVHVQSSGEANRGPEAEGTLIEPATRIQVMIVDDHPMVREGLKCCLSMRKGLEICCEAEGVDDALRAIQKVLPDLSIVDLALKDICGLELVKLLRRRVPGSKIIVHSMYDGMLYAERSLQAGAQAYVNKQADPSELIEAIDRVLEGQIYLSQETSQRLLRRKTQQVGELSSEIDLLTDRELEVFRQIGLGMTAGKISSQLHISRHTIDSHRENIKAKLGLESGTELSRRAFQWVLENG